MTNEIRTEPIEENPAGEARSSEVRDDPATRTLPLPPAPPPAKREEGAPGFLLPPPRQEELRLAWLEIQGSFIDEPGEAVRKADGLVQEVLHSVSERFEAARRELERGWNKGDEASTESMRLALRSYRVLFNRLLAL